MATIFYNADEVFEMAIKIEKNGEKFYERAAEIATEPKAKDMLQRLKDMEASHQIIFKKLRAKLVDEAIEPIVFDPNGELSKYLQAAADSHVFNVSQDLGKLLNENSTSSEIFDLAIQFEKDTIVYFLGLQDMVPEKLGKDSVAKLIQEERGHILFIKEMMSLLQA